MNEAPGPINFTMFLTLFGERLQGTDPEDVIKNAFGCFDEDNNGVLSEDRLRELLTTMGDRFTDEDVSLQYYYSSSLIFNLSLSSLRLMKCTVRHQSKIAYLIILNLQESSSMEPKTRMNNKQLSLTRGLANLKTYIFFFFFFKYLKSEKEQKTVLYYCH